MRMYMKKMDNYDPMKLIAHSYINRRECSAQECVYHVLSSQWLRKTFPVLLLQISMSQRNDLKDV